MDVQEEKMVQNAARKIELAEETEDAVRKILDLVNADTRQNCRSRCSAPSTNGAWCGPAVRLERQMPLRRVRSGIYLGDCKQSGISEFGQRTRLYTSR